MLPRARTAELVATRRRRERASGRRLLAGWVPSEALLRKLLDVSRPQRLLLSPELEQVAPGVKAGVVHVVEVDLEGVVADRLDPEDLDFLLACHKLALLRRVPLNLRGGREDP